MVGQWPQGLYFATRRTNPGGDPRDDHYVRYAPLAGPVTLSLVAQHERVTLHADGRALVSAAVVSPEDRAVDGTLVFGGWGPAAPQWRGVVRQAALHAGALAPGSADPATLRAGYDFAQGAEGGVPSLVAGAPPLHAPARVRDAPWGWLQLPHPSHATRAWFVRDVALNLAFLSPLGWWVARSRARRPVLAALLAGLALSLLIETLQLAVPGRSSTAMDLLCNTLGAGAGGVIGARSVR